MHCSQMSRPSLLCLSPFAVIHSLSPYGVQCYGSKLSDVQYTTYYHVTFYNNGAGQLWQPKDSTEFCEHHVVMKGHPPPIEISVSSPLLLCTHRRAIERVNYVVPSTDEYKFQRIHKKVNVLPCYICIIKLMQRLYYMKIGCY